MESKVKKLKHEGKYVSVLEEEVRRGRLASGKKRTLYHVRWNAGTG